MNKDTHSQKKKKTKNTRTEQMNLTGKLGGQVSNELGFGTLEAAKNWIDDKYHPWNQEELEMFREEIKAQNSRNKKR